MKKIFVDTGAWVAVEDSADPLHGKAMRYKETIAGECRLFTTDYILDETFTLLLMNSGYDCVVAFNNNLDILKRGGILQVLAIGQTFFEEAWEVFQRFNKDKQWSFTDCTTYAVMKQMGITEAFGFDHHFDQMGF